MNTIIIGNGVAGTTAAETIRKTDPTGEIKIFSDEAFPFYSRIRLMEYPAGLGKTRADRRSEHGRAAG